MQKICQGGVALQDDVQNEQKRQGYGLRGTGGGGGRGEAKSWEKASLSQLRLV